MSAPTSHDPLTVNTRDGVCWERRAVTDSGLGLYAVEGSCKCPPFKMATLAELAERGIIGSADVLPVPVGPEPSELERLRARVAELEAAAYVAPSPSCTRCYGADAARFVAKGGATTPCPVCGPSQVEQLQTRVAELEAERHSTNEALSDAAEQLRVDRDRIAELEARPLGWLDKLDAKSVDNFLISLASAAEHEPMGDAVEQVNEVIRSFRDAVNGIEAPPLMVFRASHDSIVMGYYTTREAAREHCATLMEREQPDAELHWYPDTTEGDNEEAPEDLFMVVAGEESDTGYVVTPLEVASAYDPDADE